MVMTLPHSTRPNTLNNPSRRDTHLLQTADLLPWADPYIASLIEAHERALQADRTNQKLPTQPR